LMLPLPYRRIKVWQDRRSALVMSALIVIPQVVVALLAQWVGRGADMWGHRPLLLMGFAALPIRAMSFALIRDPGLLAILQVLDGITGAAVGALTPFVIAVITKDTGRINLAQGIVGAFSGIGAALSTTATGLVAQSVGNAAGFVAVAAVALVAVAVLWACRRPNLRARFLGTERQFRIGHDALPTTVRALSHRKSQSRPCENAICEIACAA
jgi:MFS family permease